MSEAAVHTSTRTRLKPGVVTAEAYVTLVKACKTGGYALPAVNTSSSHTINAVLEAAATYKSEVIVQLSNGGAQFCAGRGFPDGDRAKILGAVSAARHVHMMAEHYGICVILHTDHASKKLIPWVEGMLDYGEAFSKETGTPLFRRFPKKTIHLCRSDLSRDKRAWSRG
jgi:fructose-bisphosphate aldolase class II